MQFSFPLVYVAGVENPAADHLSHIGIRPENRIHLKKKDCIPVFEVEINIASKTPKQQEDETDYYPRHEAAENFRKHRRHKLSRLVMTPELEQALDTLYRGKTNVALKAEELNMPLPQLKQLLSLYIQQIPPTDDAWNADIEISWPYMT